ncbi:NAD(P)-dependent alcohol dehydrogenase [Lewinellaceae bacterium SD302]|nr:NAD(P)-dependent alcohol dehydrogenase [Lewinellaceae bacterium SD302]
MTKSMMQAAVLTRYGGPGKIEIATIERPKPKANEVLVKVYATPVTAADTMMRRADPAISRLFLGFTRPRNNVMGTGFAGKVVGIGAEVEDFAVGDRVFGESGLGFAANAEYVCVAADGVIDWVPIALSYVDAATLCDGPLTSYHFLKTLANVQAGQSVLVIGASGSLGTAAVQLAHAFGARVTGVCSSRNVELVKSLGASNVIDYTKTDFTQEQETYDLIFDTIGNTSYGKCRHLLTETGIYTTPVLKFSVLLDMLRTRLFSSQRVKFAPAGLLPPEKLRAYLDEITQLITQGSLRMVIDQQYPLEDVVAAHRYVDSGRKRGNVVLVPRAAQGHSRRENKKVSGKKESVQSKTV